MAAVEAGVGAIMCSYNKINSTYACENVATLHDLKSGMGFQVSIMCSAKIATFTHVPVLGMGYVRLGCHTQHCKFC